MTETTKLKIPSFKEGENYTQATYIEIESIPQAEALADEADQIAKDIDRQLEDQRQLVVNFGLPMDKETEDWLRRSKSRRRYELQRRDILVRWLEKQEGSYYYKLRRQRDEIRQLNEKLELYAKFYEPMNTLWQQIQKMKNKIYGLEQTQKSLKERLQQDKEGIDG